MQEQKDRLEEQLVKIGWKLKHCGHEHYQLIDDVGKKSNLTFYAGQINHLNIRSNTTINFNLEYCEFEMFKETSDICISGKNNKSIFILLHQQVRTCRVGGCTDGQAKCSRCGNCCKDVGRTFWKNGVFGYPNPFGDNAILNQWAKNGDSEDSGMPCEMLIFDNGKAVCLIEQVYGAEFKPTACREHPGDERCVHKTNEAATQ